MPNRPDEVQVADYFRVLYRRRYVALLAFLAVFVSVTIHTFLTTPIYEASATIQIKDQTKKSLLSELVQLDQTNTIAAEIEIIRSRSVAEEVVRRLHLDTVLHGFPHGVGLEFEDLQVGRAMKGKVFTLTFDNDGGDYSVTGKDGDLGTGKLGEIFVAGGDDPKNKVTFRVTGEGAVGGVWFRFTQPPFRLAVQNVQNATDVRPVGDKTQILRVYYRDPQPHVARNIVNAIVDTYRERNIDENAKEARETLKFIEGQKGLVQNNLARSESDLRDYKSEHGIVSLPEEAATVIQNYAKFAVEQSRIDIEMKHHVAILKGLDDPDAGTFGLPSVNMENSVLSNLGLKLSELQTKKQELLTIVTPMHPDVIEVQGQIVELVEKNPAGRPEHAAHPGGAAPGNRRGVEGLRRATQIVAGPRTRSRRTRTRARREQRDLHVPPSKKREEARITEAATIGNIRVIDQAEMPLRPIKPNVRLNLLLGFIAGLLLAVGVAFFLDFIDDSLKSTEEVERFIRRPIYGIIPRIPPRKRDEAPEEQPPASMNLVTHHSPKSPISEAFRTLRTNIHLADPDHPITEILVTSAGPSEGKSTIVSNLALTIANTGKKTLLVDCDLRKPNVHNFFDQPRDPGVTTILSGEGAWRDIVRTTAVEHLHVLPSGPIPPNPTEMLSSNAMRELIDEFRAEYDMVLLDSPPVVAVTDAAILSSFVRSTLLVVELGRSRASGVNRAIDLLDKVKANLLGLVTNNISAGFRYDYGYYSYYYYYADSGEKKKRRRRRGRYGYY
ncbi:MAG: polysaccharide biosynthesis tyrosine autokinase [Deltaproteobacteria bacterium]|nr:polysaccharide biosynthesis tyrosine autokinase [Deltaproteobacteria bacterium]